VKILVTGASGMVGRNLLADPRAGDHEILAPPRARLDLTSQAASAAYIGAERPELIIHLAGRVGGIQANINAPAGFLAENLAIGLNVLTAARDAGVPRLINLGSSCMYPAEGPDPLTEDALLTGSPEPTNDGYALAKLASWKLALAMARETPWLDYKTLISCNLYGPFDHFDPILSHLVPAAILKIDTALRGGHGEVDIWGDGTARREFMFAPDLVDFIWRAIDRWATIPPTMNVGVGRDQSINDIFGTIAEVMGYRGAFVHDLSKPVGMRRKRLDVSRQTALGWRPKTDLAAGVAKAVEHFRAWTQRGA
jgi:GDP-L-fucose synthase